MTRSDQNGVDKPSLNDGRVSRVEVALGSAGSDRSYPVVIGYGVLADLATFVAEAAPKAKRAAVLTQEPVQAALAAAGIPCEPGIEHRWFTMADGEHHKRLSTVEALCEQWAEWGMTRNDVVIAVGGGIVTDVGGFAASCYYRGISVIYVSTTLLGMIDAAVGGKTGVNLDAGKNLVGAFWQPSAVICDLDTLASMPPRERACGYGEMAKYHFLGVDGLPELSLHEQVTRCVELKARVVAADERESGLRATLNYGHTMAHAIEIVGDHALRHGEAVAIGLVFEAELAHVLGRISAERVEEHRRVVRSFDLSVDIPSGLDRTKLIEAMGRDKKALDGLTFVLDGPEGVTSVSGVSVEAIHAAFDAMDRAGRERATR
jgi:5-deoxy-5-amino-3-dehydroquinate synthase